MSTSRSSNRRILAGGLVALALSLPTGCGKSDKPPAPAATKDASVAKPRKTPLAEAIDKALILETALDKAKAELAAAEQASPRDEAHIAERKTAIEVISNTLKITREKIEVLRAREDE